ncbi:hypothetical protein HK100_012902 [Physocladia obscura]|uniref:Uncharacterized protein n=1 Tax=Physocladia obscura TaxID=109957 RepID=A0AAD5SZ15_9FUNG|nr:hypothetical protein HK100_012902 [Physocladia obscura]
MIMTGRSSNANTNSTNAKNTTVIRTNQVLVRLPANKAAGIWQPNVFRVEIPQQHTQPPPPARFLASEHCIVPSSPRDTAIASKHVRAFVSGPAGADRLRNTKRRMGNNSNNIVVNNTGFRAMRRQKTADTGLLSPAPSLSFWGAGVLGDLGFSATSTPPVTPLGLNTDTQNISFTNSISFFNKTTTIPTTEPRTTFLDMSFPRTPTPDSQVPSPSDTLAFFSTSPPANDRLHDDAYLALQDLLFVHDDNDSSKAVFNDSSVSGSGFNPNIVHLVDGWQKTVSMLLDHQRFCAGI